MSGARGNGKKANPLDSLQRHDQNKYINSATESVARLRLGSSLVHELRIEAHKKQIAAEAAAQRLGCVVAQDASERLDAVLQEHALLQPAHAAQLMEKAQRTVSSAAIDAAIAQHASAAPYQPHPPSSSHNGLAGTSSSGEAADAAGNAHARQRPLLRASSGKHGITRVNLLTGAVEAVPEPSGAIPEWIQQRTRDMRGSDSSSDGTRGSAGEGSSDGAAGSGAAAETVTDAEAASGSASLQQQQHEEDRTSGSDTQRVPGPALSASRVPSPSPPPYPVSPAGANHSISDPSASAVDSRLTSPWFRISAEAVLGAHLAGEAATGHDMDMQGLMDKQPAAAAPTADTDIPTMVGVLRRLERRFSQTSLAFSRRSSTAGGSRPISMDNMNLQARSTGLQRVSGSGFITPTGPVAPTDPTVTAVAAAAARLRRPSFMHQLRVAVDMADAPAQSDSGASTPTLSPRHSLSHPVVQQQPDAGRGSVSVPGSVSTTPSGTASTPGSWLAARAAGMQRLPPRSATHNGALPSPGTGGAKGSPLGPAAPHPPLTPSAIGSLTAPNRPRSASMISGTPGISLRPGPRGVAASSLGPAAGQQLGAEDGLFARRSVDIGTLLAGSAPRTAPAAGSRPAGISPSGAAAAAAGGATAAGGAGAAAVVEARPRAASTGRSGFNMPRNAIPSLSSWGVQPGPGEAVPARVGISISAGGAAPDDADVRPSPFARCSSPAVTVSRPLTPTVLSAYNRSAAGRASLSSGGGISPSSSSNLGGGGRAYIPTAPPRLLKRSGSASGGGAMSMADALSAALAPGR